jgi:hypothetical protein
MACEILDYVKKIEKNPDLECQEECKQDFTCPFVSDDRYFPKVGIESPERARLRALTRTLRDIKRQLKRP